MRRALATLGAAAAALVATFFAATAYALPPIKVQYVWDKNNVLRGSFGYNQAVDDPAIKKKLANGLPVTVVMRGYIYPVGGSNPIALTAHTCKVAWDLWQEIYTIVENGVRYDSPTMKGVYRHCTQMRDLPIVDRALLTGSASSYYMAVKVEVNPINAQTIAQVKSWVTRPSGASGPITPGQALFATFVGIFMKTIASADLVLDYQSDVFPP